MTTIVPAILGGVAVLFAGALPWGLVFAPLNQRIVPALPWAIVPMAVYLWGYWRYIGGRTGSAEDAPRRAQLLRARPLALPVWTFAIVAGLTGFAAILAGTGVMGRLVTLPGSAALVAPPDMPPATMMTLLAMASLVAGVSEEAGFRGYMQGPKHAMGCCTQSS